MGRNRTNLRLGPALLQTVQPPLETLEGGGDLRKSLFGGPVDDRTMSGQAGFGQCSYSCAMPADCRTDVRVRFAETDAQGIAHHAAYLVWFEIARIDYLARFGGGYPALRAQGLEATTAVVYVKYRRSAQFDDSIVVHTRCSEVRGARFRFEYTVERDGETIAEGWTGHACVDGKTMRPTRVPAWLVEAITAAEAAES